MAFKDILTKRQLRFITLLKLKGGEKMKRLMYDFIANEDGAGAVEYGLLVGTLGFAMYEIWASVRLSLYISYGNILRTIRDMKYP